MSGFKIIAAPAAEPISLEDARLHLRLDVNDDSPPTHTDDALVLWQLGQAREWCEGWLERSLAASTFELALDAFPAGAIELPLPPTASVESIHYLDAEGVDTLLAADQYALDNYREPAEVKPAYGLTWPAARTDTNSVRVRYVSGYAFPNDSPAESPLPFAIKGAILLALGAYYENRDEWSALEPRDPATLPPAARMLLQRYRLRTSMA